LTLSDWFLYDGIIYQATFSCVLLEMQINKFYVLILSMNGHVGFVDLICD